MDKETATVINNDDSFTTQLSWKQKRQIKRENQLKEMSEIARNSINEANHYIEEAHTNTPKKSPASRGQTCHCQA